MEMFETCAHEIFTAAGVTKEQAPEMYGEVVHIMSSKMASLSATMGLSYKRVEAYDEQKQALINDLKSLAQKGKLR